MLTETLQDEDERWWPSPSWAWFWWTGGFNLVPSQPLWWRVRQGFLAVRTAYWWASGRALSEDR